MEPVARETLAPNYIILTFLLAFAIGPLLVLGFNSLKTQAELGRNPLGPPQSLNVGDFPKPGTSGNFSMTTRNSGILVAGTVVGVLVLGGMAAYSLAKLTAWRRGCHPLSADRHQPADSALSGAALFHLEPAGAGQQSFRARRDLHRHQRAVRRLPAPLLHAPAPSDFEDAARVDGASEWQVFSRIVVPLSWPGFLTVGLVVALSVWNEFLLATVFLTDQDLFTVVTSYNNFAQRFTRDWTMTSAAAIMMILPVIIIFLTLQRRFIDGLTQGGLKGIQSGSRKDRFVDSGRRVRAVQQRPRLPLRRRHRRCDGRAGRVEAAGRDARALRRNRRLRGAVGRPVGHRKRRWPLHRQHAHDPGLNQISQRRKTSRPLSSSPSALCL